MTMKEIAQETGTSQATVSRVLNGNMSVKPEIRNKVMACAKRHNYQMNVLAQSLSAKKSLLIGVLVSNISNPTFSDLVRSIEANAVKYGYSILLGNSGSDPLKEKYYLNIFSAYKVDGIIMVPRHINEHYFLNLRQGDIPVVIATDIVEGFDCVAVSFFEAGKNVAKHLIDNGYRKFAFLGSPNSDKERGFVSQLLSAGFSLENDYHFFNMQSKGPMLEKLEPLITKYRGANELALFAHNDLCALLVMDTLKQCAVKVPEEIGLIGFDNTFITKDISPAISTVDQPTAEIGAQSVEILMEKIAEKKQLLGRSIVLGSKVMARASSLK